MIVLLYLVAYFMFLLFGGMIITGFYTVTRGSIRIMPDGTKKKEGQLLRDWYLFWYQEAVTSTDGVNWKPLKKRYQYVGDELTKIVTTWQGSNYKFGIANYYNDRIVVSSHPDQRTVTMVANSLNISAILERGTEGIEVKFYKEEPEYVFPTWLRKMLAGCITCHSSWLGSIIFWTGFCVFDREMINNWFFDSAINSNLLVILTWIAYCFSLAFISPYLYKKVS